MSLRRNRGGSKVDGSDVAFIAAVEQASIGAPHITSPTAGQTGVDRTPFVIAEADIGVIWMDADVAADQTGLGLNSDLVWNELKGSSNSGISLDTDTGVITLPAFRTLHLVANILGSTFSTNTGFARLAWVNADTNVEMPRNIDAVLRPVTGTTAFSVQPSAVLFIETVDVTRVKLRVVDANLTFDVKDNGTGLIIQEVGSQKRSYQRAAFDAVLKRVSDGVTVYSSGDIGETTNHLRDSEGLGGANWSRSGTTGTPDAVAPSLDRLREAAIVVSHHASQIVTSVRSTDQLRFSRLIKPEGGLRYVRLRLLDITNNTNAVHADFDLVDVTVTTSVIGTASSADARIVALPNGWYVLYISGVPSTTDGDVMPILQFKNGPGEPVNYAGNVNVGCLDGGGSLTKDFTAQDNPPYIVTDPDPVTTPKVPAQAFLVSTVLDALTEYEWAVKDKTAKGGYTPTSKVRFTTGA